MEGLEHLDGGDPMGRLKQSLPVSDEEVAVGNTDRTEMVIDHTNIEVVKQLRDGRKSFSEIAKELGVTENTVRARVRRLLNGEVLDIQGMVNPYRIPNHFLVLVGVKLKTMDLVKKGEEFKNLKGVVSVGVVTGQFDLIVTVLLNDEFTIKNFYIEEVAKVSDVQSTEMWVVYHNVNIKVPYVL
jgi:Lrp/AsnC family transcriptional regulator for asnA, asnC and gidA